MAVLDAGGAGILEGERIRCGAGGRSAGKLPRGRGGRVGISGHGLRKRGDVVPGSAEARNHGRNVPESGAVEQPAAPRVHRAFADIWGTEKLWVSFDRTSLNPPERPGFAFKGPYLHWDISLDDPSRFMVQGVLYLSDTAANQGAFTCIPGFHRRIADWLKTLSDEDDPRTRMQAEFGHLAKPIAGREGDLVIWNSLLPHGSSPNSAERPRIAQYITMTPARDDDESHRQSRIEGWRERLTGLGKNRKEKEHLEGETARLTPLGRKLLGMDRW